MAHLYTADLRIHGLQVNLSMTGTSTDDDATLSTLTSYVELGARIEGSVAIHEHEPDLEHHERATTIATIYGIPADLRYLAKRLEAAADMAEVAQAEAHAAEETLPF
jgi:hypothetical protein